MIALDLFAGHGWGVALRRHGVELMPAAVATRDAAGMSTIFRDAWDGLLGRVDADAEAILDSYDLLIASPPCQTFSTAGRGSGRRTLDSILASIDKGTYLRPADLFALTETMDARTALVLVPLAYAVRDLPTFVTFEQVPSVLPVWEACAAVLQTLGYSTSTGILNAEQFGVPQTRRRAILIARRDGAEARMPEPTHSRYYSHDKARLDPGVESWVSMAKALGWPLGLEVVTNNVSAPGNSRDRKADGYGRYARDVALPSPTITSSARMWYPRALRSNYGTGGDSTRRGERQVSEPAPTLTSKANRNKWDGVRKMSLSEAAVLQTYPADFPFQGRQGDQFLQVGNAVPPLLAERIICATIVAEGAVIIDAVA